MKITVEPHAWHPLRMALMVVALPFFAAHVLSGILVALITGTCTFKWEAW